MQQLDATYVNLCAASKKEQQPTVLKIQGEEELNLFEMIAGAFVVLVFSYLIVAGMFGQA